MNFNPAAMRLAIDFAGADRILAGSDYPHQIGSIPLMIDMLARFDAPADVVEKIDSATRRRC